MKAAPAASFRIELCGKVRIRGLERKETSSLPPVPGCDGTEIFRLGPKPRSGNARFFSAIQCSARPLLSRRNQELLQFAVGIGVGGEAEALAGVDDEERAESHAAAEIVCCLAEGERLAKRG